MKTKTELKVLANLNADIWQISTESQEEEEVKYRE